MTKITLKYINGQMPDNISELLQNADEQDMRILIALMMAADENGEVNAEFSLADTLGLETPEIDASLILSEYKKVKDVPSSPEYKEFICSFIERIEVGKYSVKITLKTGLDIFPELNTTFEVRRQEIYERKKTG
jgi:hypothetical protein